jgi:hypothetical protein
MQLRDLLMNAVGEIKFLVGVLNVDQAVMLLVVPIDRGR